jgi:hypothetical protein
MSSREFLVLVRHLGDDSQFKTLAPQPYGRDGDWPEAMQDRGQDARRTRAVSGQQVRRRPETSTCRRCSSPRPSVPQPLLRRPRSEKASMDLENLLSTAIDL